MPASTAGSGVGIPAKTAGLRTGIAIGAAGETAEGIMKGAAGVKPGVGIAAGIEVMLGVELKTELGSGITFVAGDAIDIDDKLTAKAAGSGGGMPARTFGSKMLVLGLVATSGGELAIFWFGVSSSTAEGCITGGGAAGAADASVPNIGTSGFRGSFADGMMTVGAAVTKGVATGAADGTGTFTAGA